MKNIQCQKYEKALTPRKRRVTGSVLPLLSRANILLTEVRYFVHSKHMIQINFQNGKMVVRFWIVQNHVKIFNVKNTKKRWGIGNADYRDSFFLCWVEKHPTHRGIYNVCLMRFWYNCTSIVSWSEWAGSIFIRAIFVCFLKSQCFH